MILHGKYRGLVVDNEDPLGLGRVKAIVPSVFGEVPLDWALPCMRVGSALQVPAVGSNVWIEFEGGNPGQPIWAGIFWLIPGEPGLPEADEAAPANGRRLAVRPPADPGRR